MQTIITGKEIKEVVEVMNYDSENENDYGIRIVINSGQTFPSQKNTYLRMRELDFNAQILVRKFIAAKLGYRLPVMD